MTMLEAVYVECKEEMRIVAIKPKPAFRPLFEKAETKAQSDIILLKDTEGGKASPGDQDTTETKPCLWWRRGRAELHPEQRFEVLLAA